MEIFYCCVQEYYLRSNRSDRTLTPFASAGAAPAHRLGRRLTRILKRGYGTGKREIERFRPSRIQAVDFPIGKRGIAKEATGTNFSEMLLNIRIERAKELLAFTGDSIKDVAFQVGFNDPNYFSRVFHKTVGIKSGDYRRLGENTEQDPPVYTK